MITVSVYFMQHNRKPEVQAASWLHHSFLEARAQDPLNHANYLGLSSRASVLGTQLI